jgi:hypothetical protein
MLTALTSSVQAELDAFFADLANRAKRKRLVSAHAFAKARYKLHHDLFQPLLTQLVALTEGDLLVLDRGYPSAWLGAVLSQARIAFCIRCDMASTFKAVLTFARSGLAESQVTLPAPYRRDAEAYECQATPTTVRLSGWC